VTLVLSEHLQLIASAPEGIQKLRGLILELAVRGKLVPQDPKDEPANKLIDRINTERTQRETRGKGKKSRPDQAVSKSRPSLDVPQGWEFASLGSLLLEISSGGTPSKSNPQFWNGNIPWASVKDLGFGEPLTDTQDKITEAGLAAGAFLASAGSILVCTRMGLGKIGEAKIDVAINQDLKALLLGSEFNKQYFINFFKTLSIKGSGMTVAGIKQDELLGFVVPVPPIAEQHRIVAKVDELMALCDRLESEQNDSAIAHTQLVESLLGALTQSTDAADFEANWKRIAEHFDTLFTTEASIDALQKTILQLAIMGKLVKQDPNDEPANELLKRITLGRSRLEIQGLCKKSKTLPLNSHDDQPFRIPAGWEWTSLSKASLINPRNSEDDSTIVSFVPMAMIGTGFDGKHSQEHRKWGEIKQGFTHFAENDIGIAKITPCFENSKACVFENLQNRIGAGTTELHIIRPIEETLAPRFVLAYLKSPLFLTTGETRMTGTAGQKRLPKEFLEHNPFPLPPLAEQHRIVTKIDELMASCEQLKTTLKAATAAQSTLSSALIQHALEAA
jgi:type I restriction enzyme S subunit